MTSRLASSTNSQDGGRGHFSLRGKERERGGEAMEKIGHVVNQRTDVNFFNLLPFRQPETLVSESGSYRLLYAGAGDRAWDKTAGERGTVGEGGRKFSSHRKI